MAPRMITAATMAMVVALVLLSSSTGGEGVICGSHPCAPCQVPDISAGSSNDKCAAWCISEKFDTGACYSDPKQLLICVCERPCLGEAHGALTP